MSESPSESSLQFVIRLGDLRKPLKPGTSYTIGREPSCDLRLGHGTVSPIHCRLQVTETAVLVHDLNSLCGTKVDERPVMDSPWAPGQVLEVGDIRIELQTQAMAAPQVLVPPAHHRQEPTFAEVMATELKRAPWLALSMLAHGLVLMLLWLFLDQPVPMGSGGVTVALEESEAEETYDEERITEETVELEETRDESFQEVEAEVELEEEMFFEEIDTPSHAGAIDNEDLMRGFGGAGLDDILRAGKGALSGNFKKTVAGLRRDGLEIVFVFDSTGSMGHVLQAAKERLARMVSVLLELVPYARIGVVTYRDRGRGEAYVTRQVPLSRDFYRSINFLNVVFAAGGGDEPEAVLDALQAAVRQRWSPTARRLVILVGDAPPHAEDEGRISSMVKSFARNGRSFVHAIITRPGDDSRTGATTQRTFRRIARDGRGEALEFADEGKILKAVMSLAFGPRERRSLDEVYRLAEGRNRRATGRSMRLARADDSAGRQRLRREFARPVVPHDLVKAILLEPRRPVLEELVRIIADERFHNPGRHAAAYILGRALELDAVPVDPEGCHPITSAQASDLRRRIRERFK